MTTQVTINNNKIKQALVLINVVCDAYKYKNSVSKITKEI